MPEIIGIGFAVLLVILGLIGWVVTNYLGKLDEVYKKFILMKLPESQVITQSVAIKADKDFTTIPPPPIGAATCEHDWEVLTKDILEVPHEKKIVTILKCRRCGSLDKTVATTSTPPPPPKLPEPPFVRGDCKHSWAEEKAVNLSSAFEQYAKACSESAKGFGKFEIDDVPKDFFQKTYLKVWVCTKCGDIHETRATNYEVPEKVEDE